MKVPGVERQPETSAHGRKHKDHEEERNMRGGSWVLVL